MKISAIICEYNPLHSGHIYHIRQTRALTGCDILIALMSGSFVQRGRPAVYDKWARTKAALAAGADAVIELPALYATSSAEGFAFGGVSLLDSLGIIDSLSFGCESTDMDALRALAAMLVEEPYEYKAALKSALARGLSFPAARSEAAGLMMPGSGELLSMPNSILAVEYLKALMRLSSGIAPVAVPRLGAGESERELACEPPSALAVRTALKQGASADTLLPKSVLPYFEDERPVFFEDAFSLIVYRIRSMSAESLSQTEGMAEGLHNRIREAAMSARSLGELIAGIKSKRYTETRICRVLTNILLGVSKSAAAASDNAGLYARVLGVRESARGLLSTLSMYSSCPVIINPAGSSHPGLLADIYASDIHSLLSGKPMGRDYTERLVIM